MARSRARGSRNSRAHPLEVHPAEARETAFEEIVRAIPIGTVVSYGQVAEAAGYPRGHRMVARFLHDTMCLDIPWQRVVGADGEIKLRGAAAARQRALLRAEGVGFAGRRVDMARHRHVFEC